MQVDLAGRAFVVGRASRGFGRAIAAELVGSGARVLMLSRSEEAVTAAATEIGDAAFPLAADMGAQDTSERVRAAVEEKLGGGLDGVVVNHGGPPLGKALELSDDDWLGSYQLLIGGPPRRPRGPPALVGGGGGTPVRLS